MEGLQDLVWQVLTVILVGMAGLVVDALRQYLKSKAGKELAEKVNQTIAGKEWIIKLVVEGIQQGYEEMDGEGKLKVAKEEVAKLFQKYGFDVDVEEINRLIEAMYKEMKDKEANLIVGEIDDNELPRHIGYTQMTLDDFE